MSAREPLWRRYLRLIRPDPAGDVDDELTGHYERLVEDLIARGVDPDAARRRAAKRMGDLGGAREECVAIAHRTEQRAAATERLAGLGQDLRHAARGLRRSPAFTAVAALTLALGIGATTAMFSLADGVLLRPLPYGDPGSLVMLWEHNIPRDRGRNVANPGNVVDWRSRSRSFEGVAIFTWSGLTFTGGDAAERVSGRAVEWNFFDVLRAPPALGRTFRAADADSTGTRPVVLSHGLWQRRFGGDPAVVGSTAEVAGGAVQVIGVMPASFRPTDDEEFWGLAVVPPNLARVGRWVMAVGRLRDGVGAAAAQAELRTIATQLEQEYPDLNAGWTVDVIPLHDDVVGSARLRLLVAVGAVGLVLLIACANVGNLLLVRAEARRHEMAVRAALGATRARVARLWLTESAILTGLGVALGFALAWAMLQGFIAIAPPDVPRLNEVRFDYRAFGFGGLVALAAAAALGLGAGLGASTRAVLALREGSGASPDATARRFRNGLVVAQMALAIVLLVSAGLLIRTLDRLTRVDPGFDPAGVVAAEISLPGALYPDDARVNAFFRDALGRLRAQPGVDAAGIVSKAPMAGMAGATSFYPADRPEPTGGTAPVADIRTADEEYFRVMGIPLLRGRLLTDADGAAPVVVVSATLAREIWPDQDPLGRTLRVHWISEEAPPMTVVGVVGDVRAVALDADVRPMIYYALDASPNSLMTLVVRGRDPAALSSAIRGVVSSLDRSVPVRDVVPMTRWVRESLAERRSPALLLGLFAGMALLLAAVGLYGVLAYAVHLQRKEIGIRMALGAGRAAVVWLVVRNGLALAGIGLALGVGFALAGNRVLGSMLVGTSPGDPLVIGGTATLLLAVALLASWVPARRAAHVAPSTVIRAD